MLINGVGKFQEVFHLCQEERKMPKGIWSKLHLEEIAERHLEDILKHRMNTSVSSTCA